MDVSYCLCLIAAEIFVVRYLNFGCTLQIRLLRADRNFGLKYTCVFHATDMTSGLLRLSSPSKLSTKSQVSCFACKEGEEDPMMSYI